MISPDMLTRKSGAKHRRRVSAVSAKRGTFEFDRKEIKRSRSEHLISPDMLTRKPGCEATEDMLLRSMSDRARSARFSSCPATPQLCTFAPQMQLTRVSCRNAVPMPSVT